jgi:hypothetical protein
MQTPSRNASRFVQGLDRISWMVECGNSNILLDQYFWRKFLRQLLLMKDSVSLSLVAFWLHLDRSPFFF